MAEEKKDLDRLEKLVMALVPILEEMSELKKIIDEKTFKEITKNLEEYNK